MEPYIFVIIAVVAFGLVVGFLNRDRRCTSDKILVI